jgi:hypothetical protein
MKVSLFWRFYMYCTHVNARDVKWGRAVVSCWRRWLHFGGVLLERFHCISRTCPTTTWADKVAAPPLLQLTRLPHHCSSWQGCPTTAPADKAAPPLLQLTRLPHHCSSWQGCPTTAPADKAVPLLLRLTRWLLLHCSGWQGCPSTTPADKAAAPPLLRLTRLPVNHYYELRCWIGFFHLREKTF